MVNDKVTLTALQDAFDIMGFNQTERDNIYKITASVLNFGEMAFKQKGEDQAEPDGTEVRQTITTKESTTVNKCTDNIHEIN